MKKYRHIFIDLDRTMWDFDQNSKECLSDIFADYALGCRGVSDFESFYGIYHDVNLHLWALYREGKIEKEVLSVKRFHDSLLQFGIDDDELSQKMAREYIERSPRKTRLFPEVKETLDYLVAKDYHLHIITNGFNEVQFTKIKNSGLEPYFRSVITSEEARSRKPDRQIFQHAMQRTGAEAFNSLMVGDDHEVDIEGAKGVGMDQVFVDYPGGNSELEATYYITAFDELKNIL